MSLSGQWEGKLVDVTGVSGLIKLALKESRGRVEGDYSVYFLAPSEGGCCAPERRLVQSGVVSGKFDSKNNALRIDYTLSVDQKPASVRLAANLRDAMPHARKALFGCYEVRTDQADLTLQGGGIVLWQYA